MQASAEHDPKRVVNVLPIVIAVRSRTLLNSCGVVFALLLAFVTIINGGSASAQQEQPPEPRLNQPGKDVQWVPTPPGARREDARHGGCDTEGSARRSWVGRRGPRDCGGQARRPRAWDRIRPRSGRVLEAQRRGGRRQVAHQIRSRDIFKSDFSDATVVTTFLLPSMNLRLRPTFLAMKPGTRIVANTFAIGEWQPDESAAIEPCERWCTALLWIVPARVGGTWLTPKGDLILTQRFQFVSGTLGKAPIADGRLRGDQISFMVGESTYAGRVQGNQMRVRATVDGQTTEWTGTARPRSQR